MTDFNPGDRVLVHLGPKQRVPDGWYPGTIFHIDPYSAHRSFFWVELDSSVQALLGLTRISILNPRNLQKLDPGP
jgi:hypothetical protein